MKAKQKVYEGHGSSARTDDSTLSPATNSARPAGCGITSLAGVEASIICNPVNCCQSMGGAGPNCLEGRALNQRSAEMTVIEDTTMHSLDLGHYSHFAMEGLVG